MNSRDKIEALKMQLILHPSYLTIIEEIEKDLEVLEILKRHSTRLDEEDWNTNIFNGIDYEDLDDKESKIIKEWLENEQD